METVNADFKIDSENIDVTIRKVLLQEIAPFLGMGVTPSSLMKIIGRNCQVVKKCEVPNDDTKGRPALREVLNEVCEQDRNVLYFVECLGDWYHKPGEFSERDFTAYLFDPQTKKGMIFTKPGKMSYNRGDMYHDLGDLFDNFYRRFHNQN